MRLRFSTSSFFTGVVLALYACNSRNFSETAQCEAVTSYIAWEISELVDEKLVFATRNTNLNIGHASEAEIEEFVMMDWFDLRGKSPWSQDIPYKTIKKTLAEKQSLRSFLGNPEMVDAVTSCQNLRSLLQKKSIMTGQRAVEQVISLKNKKTGQYPRAIHAQYMPILSGDGQSAMVFASQSYGELAGGGLIIKIERQATGEWKPTRAHVLWVS